MRIELNDAERSELQARARRRKFARGDAMRAEIVLLAADGMTNLAIAERLVVGSTSDRAEADLQPAQATQDIVNGG